MIICGKLVNTVNPINDNTPMIKRITSQFANEREKNSRFMIRGSIAVKMPIIITRGNNFYGLNQYPEKVIQKFIQQIKNGEKITIQGDVSCVRGFLHVNDKVDEFIKELIQGADTTRPVSVSIHNHHNNQNIQKNCVTKVNKNNPQNFGM